MKRITFGRRSIAPPSPSSSDHRNQIGLQTDEGSERIKTAFLVNYGITADSCA
jgi:hypothetical protein